MTEIKMLSFVFAIILMIYGIFVDIKERKFPNQILLSIILLGILYSTISQQIIPALGLFVCINFVGMFAHSMKILSAGDIKFASTFVFFFNLSDMNTLLFFLVSTLIIGLTYGMVFPFFHYRNKEERKAHYQTELNNLRCFFYTKSMIRSKSEYKTAEEMKKNTHPFTVQLFASFVVTMLLSNIYVI